MNLNDLFSKNVHPPEENTKNLSQTISKVVTENQESNLENPPSKGPILIPTDEEGITFVQQPQNCEKLSPEELYQHAKQFEKEYKEGNTYSSATSLAYYILASRKGHAEASYNLGDKYFNGRQVKTSLKLACHYYDEAAKQGYTFAFIQLGRLYENGFGVEKSLEKAFECYKKGAEEKFYAGYLFLAHCYEDGIGTEKNLKLAKEYYEKTIVNKDIKSWAMDNETYGFEETNKDLAYLYFQKAFLSFLALTEREDVEAHFKVAEYYREGRGVCKSLERSKVYFNNAIKLIEKFPHYYKQSEYLLDLLKETSKDNFVAQYELANEYRGWYGLSYLFTAFMQMSADQGYLRAIIDLASAYDKGEEGLAIDPEKAFFYYQKAADGGSTSVYYELGDFYQFGIHVPQSYEKAFEYYKKADTPKSYLKLGYFYEEGFGVQKDPYLAREYYIKYLEAVKDRDLFVPQEKKLDSLWDNYRKIKSPTKELERAAQWFFLHNRAEAEIGNAAAQCIVAKCYTISKGVKFDETKAFQYYLLSANQSHAEAERWLGMRYQLNAFGAESDEIAVHYYKRAVAHGDPWALGLLGFCYEQGRGVPHSIDEARMLYQKFVDLIPKFPDSRFFLFVSGADDLKTLFTRAREFLDYKHNKLTQLSLRPYSHKDCPIRFKKSKECFSKEDFYEVTPEEFQKIKLAADQGNTEALYDVARCYLEGNGTIKSIYEFEKYASLALQKEYPNLFFEMGWKYDHGVFPFKQSYENAIRCYEKALEYGDPDAQVTLGYFYEHGIGVAPSKDKALAYYKEAAKKKNIWACGLLLNAAEEGWATLEPVEEDNLLKYCTHNSHFTQNQILNRWKLYYHDNFGRDSPKKAFRYLQRAFFIAKAFAKLNDPKAFSYLSDLYACGGGCQQSDILAMECVKKAAELGHQGSIEKLVNIIEKGEALGEMKRPLSLRWKECALRYCSPDSFISHICKKACEYSELRKYREAMNFVSQAVSQDDPDGHCFLGIFCHNYKNKENLVEYTDINFYQEGRIHFQKSAAAGNLYGQCYFAKCLSKYPIYDHKMAFLLFQKAADQGILEAQFELAEAYRKGRGTEISPQKAFYHYKIVADAGDYEAQLWVAIAYAFGWGVEASFEKAFIYLKESATNGDAIGNWLLGLCYESGFEVVVDKNKAWECYNKAAHTGFTRAYYELGRLYKDLFPNGPTELIPYYYRQASDSDPRACYELAKLYENGDYLQKNREKAFAFFEKSANENYAPAQYAVAEYYLRNSDRKSLEKVYRYFAMAAKQNYLDATEKAKMYLEQLKKSQNQNESTLLPLTFIASKPKKMLEQWFAQIIRKKKIVYCPKEKFPIHSYLPDIPNLKLKVTLFRVSSKSSKLLKHNWKVLAKPILDITKTLDLNLPEQIKERAFLCLKENADAGNAKAQYLVSQFYHYGIGTAELPEKHIYYLKLAADQGYEEAAYLLACGYDQGFYKLNQSYEDAFHYYQIAASQGDCYSNYILGYFSEKGLGTEQSYEKAFEFYKKAIIDAEWTYSGYIANLYEKGYGVPKSAQLSRSHYKLFLDGISHFNSTWVDDEETGLKHLKNGEIEIGQRYLFNAFLYCKAKALKDDATAHIKLSQFYFNGYGTEQSYELAAYYMRRAHEIQWKEIKPTLDPNDPEDARTIAVWELQKQADNGNVDAQYRLALCYAYGQGIEISEELHSYYLQLAAMNGNIEAQVHLGGAYEFASSPFPCDLEKAVYWYQLASQREPGALYLLGYFYEQGAVVEKSLEKAIECYHEAVLQGEDHAIGILSYFVEKGIGGIGMSIQNAHDGYELYSENINFTEKQYLTEKYLGVSTNNSFAKHHAFFLCFIYSRAKAEFGDAKAQCEVADFYRHGWGVEKSLEDAAHYYALAAEQEYPEALCWLGYFYEHGLYYSQSDEKAISYYQRAASYKNGMALSQLGQMCEKGKLVQTNMKPNEYYKQALKGEWNQSELNQDERKFFSYLYAKARLGDASAWFNTAKYFRFGSEIEHSDRDFKNYLKKAADLGNREAAFSLGNIYDFKERNYELARHYYQLAANKGHTTAKAYLGHFYEFGLGVQQSIEKALDCYKEAAKQKNPCALRSLAHCYENGNGVTKSHEVAEEYNSMAYKLPNEHESWSSRVVRCVSVRKMLDVNKDDDPYYQLFLGDFYLRGIDGRRNDAKAQKAYETAAELGLKEAQHMLSYFEKHAA